MRIAATVCFLIAAATVMPAVATIIAHSRQPVEAANLVGYAVGALLIPMAFLIAGAYLWNRPKRK